MLRIKSSKLWNEDIEILQKALQEKHERLQQKIEVTIADLQRIAAYFSKKHDGLSSARIQKFTQLTADQSHAGDQCAICMEDFEIGRNMMRLDCDGRHAFCQVCIEGWIADNNTCPLCRHKF